MERWETLPDFPKYQISDSGKIMNRETQHILTPYKNHKGYLKVAIIGTDGKPHKKRVHRLVAQTFIPNTNGLPEVNHKNLNKQDNTVTNLEWVTGEENREHYKRMKNERTHSV